MSTTRTRPAPALHDAYAVCSAVTRSQARNFSYGIRLLPPDKREALCAVYAMARRIDDIGDGDLPLADKRAALAAVRASLSGPVPDGDPVAAAVRDAARRFPIPLEALAELVDGVEMDVEMDAGLRRYATLDDLVLYCRRVAGTVGRLSLGIFGSAPDPRAAAHADALGVGLQLTNILRDVREDLAHGRVYLPAAELERHGVSLRLGPDGALVADPGLSPLLRATADVARTWYARGWQLVPLLDFRSAACTTAMAGIYRRLLEQISAEPDLVRDRRLSLSGWQKAAVAARAISGGGR